MRQWMRWSIFSASVLVGCFAMAWLSAETWRVDRNRMEALSRAQASQAESVRFSQQVDLQERISRAVWRLDSMLAPLVAQEATRSAQSFQSLVRTDGDGADGAMELAPGPLVHAVSPYIYLHFQVDESGVWTSPQVLDDVDPVQLESLGLAEFSPETSRERFEYLQANFSCRTFMQRLPTESFLIDPTKLVGSNVFNYNNGNVDLPVPQTSSYGEQAVRQVLQQQELSSELPEGNGQRDDESGQVAAVQQALSSGPSQISDLQRGEFRDWNQRNLVYENFANTALANQLIEQKGGKGGLPVDVVRPLTQPLWIDGELFLARYRVLEDGRKVVQGCWLNWPELQRQMRLDVGDILTNVQFEPVDETTELRFSNLLATLPIQLRVDERLQVEEVSERQPSSPIVFAIGLAWLGFVVSIAVGGVLLLNAEALSERRARFVSSVTHELRTPLTTFRMYTEMLGSGMVDREEDRRGYLATLSKEASRLSHLVDNVLAYSRLEQGARGSSRRPQRVEELVERLVPRLSERVRQAGCEVEFVCDVSDGVVVETDEVGVEQVLANLLDNACKYGRDAESLPFELALHQKGARLEWSVRDHGVGVTAGEAAKIFRPFCKSDFEAAKSAPGIGLGLALSRRLARELGGDLVLDEECEGGARFVLRLPLCG